MGNGFYFVACIPNRYNKMGKIDYIQLFDKFLQKQASPEEVQMLILWLKNEGEFQDWADEQWNAVSFDIDTDLQQKLFGRIKEKIDRKNNTQAFTKQGKSHKIYLWTARVASIVILLLLTGLSTYYYAMNLQDMEDMIVLVERGQKANVILLSLIHI